MGGVNTTPSGKAQSGFPWAVTNWSHSSLIFPAKVVNVGQRDVAAATARPATTKTYLPLLRLPAAVCCSIGGLYGLATEKY
jgi:hypothetical protein